MADQFLQSNCANCNELYGRIRRFNRLAVAVQPLVEGLRAGQVTFLGIEAEQAIVTAFDLYATASVDGEIRAASAALEPSPKTERSR